MTAPRRGPIPMRASWAVVGMVLCLCLGAGWGIILGYAVGHAPDPPQRCWVDTVRTAHDGEVYSIRYIDDDGFPRMVQVDGPEARDRVEAWARR